MSNEFLNELLALHPELQEEYNSEQYKMSLEIIELMMSIGLDSKTAAKRIGCSHNQYLRMESGDVSVPVHMLKIAEENAKYSVQNYYRTSSAVAIVSQEKDDSRFFVKEYINKMLDYIPTGEGKSSKSLIELAFGHFSKQSIQNHLSIPGKTGYIGESDSNQDLIYHY